MHETQYENRIQELKNNIKYYEMRIEFLNHLKFKTKKNGEPFAKIENNFEFEGYNVKFCKECIGLHGNDYKIYFNNPKTFENGYLTISGYKNLEYSYKLGDYITPEGVTPDRVIKARYEVPYYILNFEEVKKEFETQKENFIKWLAQEKEHLKEFEAVKADIVKFENEILSKYKHISYNDIKDVLFFYNKG